MSINWVMLSATEGFTPLPGEQRLYTSPPRTALSIHSLNAYPGQEPFSVSSSAGCVHLTNRRIVYLPAKPSLALQSFAAPILNLHDTHVAAPFFGPNVWTAILQPVPGGGIPPQHAALEVKMTFKDGGAFDFHSIFERIKERLQQAVEVARESGQLTGDGSETGGGSGPGALAGVNMDAVHLDELPTYESSQVTSPRVLNEASEQRDSGVAMRGSPYTPPEEVFTPPAEPPPGYEETQLESVADELERRLRNASSSS